MRKLYPPEKFKFNLFFFRLQVYVTIILVIVSFRMTISLSFYLMKTHSLINDTFIFML
ncbi:hypothetical protein BDF14DRAFT_1804686 [Spinellus fusiger]|nr:hypothetical protein BDF14DRAFT_1804686 [Spinellus fusiger]